MELVVVPRDAVFLIIMQTFLPVVIPGNLLATFQESAKVLDYRRLGKQRVEALQIVLTLMNESTGWQHHPAVKMWRHYLPALNVYGRTMCEEWIRRGYRDTCLNQFSNPVSMSAPHWLYEPAFSASHRSNLLRKDPAWYGQWGWTEGPDLPYYWPSPEPSPASFSSETI